MSQEENKQFSNYITVKSFSEGMSNSIFFGIGLILIILIGTKIEMIGKIAFWFYAFVTLLDGIRIVIILVSEIILLFSKTKKPKTKVAMIIQTVEFFLFLMYTIILYRIFI